MHLEVAGDRPRQAIARASPDPGPTPLRRLRRVALVVSLVVLTPALFSYVHTMSGPSNSSFGIRSVEWLRDHGAASIVAKVESIYYSLTAPSKGGPGLRAVPHVGYAAVPATGAGALGSGRPIEYRPPRVPALLGTALPGEGVWHATRPGLESSESTPPVLVTTLRDQPEYPRVVAGLAWINTKRTSLSLNPGRLEPAVTLPRGAMEVAQTQRSTLLAAFNSAFKLSDSGGGVVLAGHTYAPMRDGQATIVGYANGRVDVIDWAYGATTPASVQFARQNLHLLIDEGTLAANLENNEEWGATVGAAVLVWRSGIGVDENGNLIYAAGEDQTVSSLAHALKRAGAVRAMELDINSYWTSFITYGAPGAQQPKNLLPGMERSSSRYLEPDDRDFFTVNSR